MNYLTLDAFNFTLAAYSIANYNSDESSDIAKVTFAVLRGMIKKLQSRFPEYKCFACWDTFGGTAFRKEQYKDYKSNRDYNKTDFETVRACSSVYEEFGFTNVYVPECEADDALFVLCKLLREKDKDADIIVVSRDHDMLQIVQNGYANNVWDNTKKKYLDIPAYSVVDMKSLVGDGSDNIKGVPGIGPKTAIKILSGFKELTESEKEIFEKCKNVIDATRHPRFQENLEYIKENYINKL